MAAHSSPISGGWSAARRMRISFLRAWTERRLWLGLVAALVGGLGQHLLFQEASRVQGEVLLAAAAGLAAVTWGALCDRPLLPAVPSNRAYENK